MSRRTPLRHGASALGLAVLFLSAPTSARAQEDHATHEFHPNHAGVSIGGMTPLSETSETSLALGAEYERLFNPTWGLGIGVDFTFGDHKRASLAQVGVLYHFGGGFKVQTGPGFEVVEKDKSDGGTSKKAFFIWALGAGYDFHVGDLSIGPMVTLDFVGDTKTNLTYVLAIGTGF